MIGITGRRSAIVAEFSKFVTDQIVFARTRNLPTNLDKYLLCAGVLHGKRACDMTPWQINETLMVNYVEVVKFLNTLFTLNKSAKVCVIGSESGYNGSYDEIYAGSKAALHRYVETTKLRYPDQQLVAVSPTIIEGTGMTNRRVDHDAAIERGSKRRRGRWLNAAEVARVAHFALSEPALCNTVIRVTGGNW